MSRLQDVARLDERTVQDAPRHAQRRSRRQPRRSAQPLVEVTRMHPGLWRLAMQHADGNARRIRIVSPVEFVVEP